MTPFQLRDKAIRALYPNTVVVSGDKAFDNSGVEITIDESFISEEILRLEAEHAATEYKRLRAPEYPAIGDQLDAILKHLNYRRTQGDELVQEMDNIIGDWLAVKARFPKNG